jgi:exopolysaccharide biosynthesis polyprenyl glycosylphosphotransferase
MHSPLVSLPAWLAPGLAVSEQRPGGAGGGMARVGRPEQPLNTSAGPIARLAAELRRLRGTRTYRELATATGLSIATLRTAAAGEHLPTWNVTRDFAVACAGDEAAVRRLWEDACTWVGRPVTAGSRPSEPPVPGPGEVTSAGQLVDMMRRLRAWAGNPSLAALNERSGGFLLPPSTVSDMLRGQRLPRLVLLSAFVRACGLDGDQAAEWERAWAELHERERTSPQSVGPGEPVALGAVATALERQEPGRRWAAWAVLADFGCAVAGTLMAAELGIAGPVAGVYAGLSLALPVAWLAAIWLADGYDGRFAGAGPEEFRKIFTAGGGLLAAAAICSWALDIGLPRRYLLIAIPVITLLDLVARYAMRKHLHRVRAAGRHVRGAVVVGHEPSVADLITELRRDKYHGLAVVAACLARPSARRQIAGVPVHGGIDDVTAAVRHFTAQTVVVLACPEMGSSRLRALAWDLEKTGTDLYVSPALLDVAGPRITVRPTPGMTLLHVDHPPLDGMRLVMKSVFDRCVSAAALILLSPLLAALATAIWLSDHGPALFTQVRVGKNGNVFRIYKFRTMVTNDQQHTSELLARNDADGALFKLNRDPRITPLGARLRRWSLDELPQLINVIRGDMSLVGPRPALPDEAANYAEHVRRRLVVKPGLTGLWQVNHRSDLSWDDSVRLDLRYVENWSFSLDLSILWKTIAVLVREPGAY